MIEPILVTCLMCSEEFNYYLDEHTGQQCIVNSENGYACIECIKFAFESVGYPTE